MMDTDRGRVEVRRAGTPAEFADALELMVAYVEWLPFELCFQDFDAERADLAAWYRAPGGVWLGRVGETARGVVGLNDLGGGVAELKRLWVAPAARGHGLGDRLVAAAIDAAREAGFASVRLDTVSPAMDAAIAIYRRHGFVEIEPYRDNPIPGARFFERVLGDSEARRQ